MPGETLTSVVGISFEYKNRAGQFMARYLQGLGQKKILGVKCPTCKKVYIPPRSVCGTCFAPMKNTQELPQVGVLKNFTVSHVTIENGEMKDSASPCIIGLIKLDKVDSLLTAVVTGVDPGAVKAGLKVRAVWKNPPDETYSSLASFEVIQAPSRKKAR